MFKMVKIPLILKLRKERHKEIAGAQDIVVQELYKVFNNAIIHGGTVIWRCYDGNRFSEDIDVYIERDLKKINLLFKNLEKIGFVIEKKKISENSLYSNLNLGGVIVRLEALFIKKNRFLKEYETAEGNLINIYTLTPEDILKEKIDTYLKRLKIRDLYDIFFLLRYVKSEKEIKIDLNRFIKRFKKPIDEEDLKVLIIQGIVPDLDKMIFYIRRFLK